MDYPRIIGVASVAEQGRIALVENKIAEDEIGVEFFQRSELLFDLVRR